MSGILRRGNVLSAALVVATVLLVAGSTAEARTFDGLNKGRQLGLKSAQNPEYCVVSHNINQLVLAVNNNGTFGTGFVSGLLQDCITGGPIKSAEYPKGSNRSYLFGAAFWIGAVVGRDTLVSVGADGWAGCRDPEFVPETAPFGAIEYRSITDPSNPQVFEGAISEQDFIAEYADTLVPGHNQECTDNIDGRAHLPLNIGVQQRSFAWSYAYAEDFILFDYEIRNIGFRTLEEVYMGVYVDGDVGDEGSFEDAQDDITGFLKTFTLPQGDCMYEDTVDIAWLADNDGDPADGSFGEESSPNVTATRIVRTPNPDLRVSYNWWISNGTAEFDYGPRHKRNPRDFGTGGRGTPEGDRNKYYVLSNGENDFDQAFTGSITSADTLWEVPPPSAEQISRALDTRYLLSFGPFEVKPGDRLPISLAYVAGSNLHQDPENWNNNLAPGMYNPQLFYDNLSFFDLGLNSRWASWIYDNPGVDTDNDGTRGSYRLCCADSLLQIDTLDGGVIDTTTIPDLATCDTLFWIGDGVPDFRGASPPPPPGTWTSDQGVPALRIAGLDGAVRIRWNGLLSETAVDPFSNEADFEGYRVYLGLDNRSQSFSVVASYDRENFNRYTLDPRPGQPLNFSLKEIPFTLDSLQALYGDNFEPLRFSRNNPFRVEGFPDSVFYFEQQDFNVSELGVETDIRKVFDEAEEPEFDNLAGEYILTAEDTTDDGFIKFFEYEIYVDSLLPTIPYWINVTAFDFGSPVSGLPSLESAVTLGSVSAYTDANASEVDQRGLEVFVYPNPYLNDGEYLDRGYERLSSEGRLLSEERAKQVTFQNLPARARISIFSLDGDLVREINHDWSNDPDNPLSGRAQWDLITRNTQLAVSGLYYWTVENLDTGETQIGKLMLIM